MRDIAIMRVTATSTSSSESIEPLGGCAGVARGGGVGVTIACTGVPGGCGGCIVVGVRTTAGGAVVVGVVALTSVIACVTPTPTVVALAGLVATPTTPVG